ncbi:hypothetical protein JCM8547_006372 [Rhodosporidiobolus lusitaniae]
MKAGEFIEDSLYNPEYGYFATKVEIFDPDRAREGEGGKRGEGKAVEGGRGGKGKNRRSALPGAPPPSPAPPSPSPAPSVPSSSSTTSPAASLTRAEGFDFPSFPSTSAFEDEVARRYMVFEGRGTAGDETQPPAAGERAGRQVWHTPTELFKPWYGRALARYLLSQYLSSPPPSSSSSSSSLSSSSSSSPSLTASGTSRPSYPYDDLIIYEIGAGNGTLMGDILDYIAENEPEVYARTRYRIIEISERLKGLQEGRARGGGLGGEGQGGGGGDSAEKELQEVRRRGHEGRVEVVRKSIFEWDRVMEEPCFFLAMEVLDNFPHDVIRYSTTTNEPYECAIAIDSSGDFTELYTPVSDPLISRYLSYRSLLPSSPSRPSSSSSSSSHPLPPLGCLPLPLQYLPTSLASPLQKWAHTLLPFAPNLTPPEFLPTRQLQLLEVLRDKFPRHRLVMSDFETLPDSVKGEMGPVVQTRYMGETVPCTTYLVQPGFFDIFFPTSFRTLAELYALVMSLPSLTTSQTSSHSSLSPSFFTARRTPGERRTLQVYEHREFLERWAETDRTRTDDGSNPLLESYENARWVVS